MAFHGSFPAIILVITGIYIRTPLILATWKSSKIYLEWETPGSRNERRCTAGQLKEEGAPLTQCCPPPFLVTAVHVLDECRLFLLIYDV
jgi:hypothetical protein